MSERDMVERVRKALLRDLQLPMKKGGMHGCLFVNKPSKDARDIAVRGHIDLDSLARAAVAALEEPPQ